MAVFWADHCVERWWWAPCYYLWALAIALQLYWRASFFRQLRLAKTPEEVDQADSVYRDKGKQGLFIFLVILCTFVHFTAGLYLSWLWVPMFLGPCVVLGVGIPVVIHLQGQPAAHRKAELASLAAEQESLAAEQERLRKLELRWLEPLQTLKQPTTDMSVIRAHVPPPGSAQEVMSLLEQANTLKAELDLKPDLPLRETIAQASAKLSLESQTHDMPLKAAAEVCLAALDRSAPTHVVL